MDCLADLWLATHHPLGALVMLYVGRGTYAYNQTYDKLIGFLSDCTVLQPSDAAQQTATFTLGVSYFNSPWTIERILQSLQFIDHFKTDTALFKTTPVWNLSLYTGSLDPGMRRNRFTSRKSF